MNLIYGQLKRQLLNLVFYPRVLMFHSLPYFLAVRYEIDIKGTGVTLYFALAALRLTLMD
jgi:hypothetical protein